MTTTALPHNRIGIDYRQVPAHKIPGPFIDAHMHAHGVEATRRFLEAASAYGFRKIWTMAPLEDVDGLRAAYPDVFEFIAVPKWQDGGPGDSFISDWMRRLDAFHGKGSRLAKFHFAPGTQKRWQMNYHHSQMQRVIRHAYSLGYHFMSHVNDPKAWFAPGGRYANPAEYAPFDQQFAMLEEFLAEYPDRIHLGAHMGGSLEDLSGLARRLDRFPHYVIDSSATKWIVRAIAQQNPAEVRDFFHRYQDRILFGSDLVVADIFDFDHYASRYWTHLHQWETSYQGPSPIDDPDAPADWDGPRLSGLDLTPAILEKLYRRNAQRWLPTAIDAPRL